MNAVTTVALAVGAGFEGSNGPATANLSVTDSAVAETTCKPTNETKDYFVERNGLRFAGTHLLLDLWGAENLADLAGIEAALRGAAEASGATVLHLNLHCFEPNGGISGVAVLAESHISIHTWPERGFAALDLFMCGSCDPYLAIPVFKTFFKAKTVLLSEQKRGLVP